MRVSSPRPTFVDGSHLSKGCDAQQKLPINSTSAVRDRTLTCFLSPLVFLNEWTRGMYVHRPVLMYGWLCCFESLGYDLFGSFILSQMNWHGPGIHHSHMAASHIQGGLVKSLAILFLDKQASFLHSATTRPPGTNYSISFLATRGHWNVFLCFPHHHQSSPTLLNG